MSVVINGSAGVTTNSGAVYDGIQRGTAVASTSGTSIDFTSIPSWVRRITVILSGVSTNGTSLMQVQLGSGSFTTTGYVSAGWASNTTTNSSTTGLLLNALTAAANLQSGALVINQISSNVWVSSGNFAFNGGGATVVGGSISLGGTLDRVRITTVNGTDTFDAGTINILFE